MNGIRLGVIGLNRFGEEVKGTEITQPEFHVDHPKVARLDQDADGVWWLTRTGPGVTQLHVRARVTNADAGGWDHHRGTVQIGDKPHEPQGELAHATDNHSVAELAIAFGGDPDVAEESYSYTGYTGGDFAGDDDSYGIRAEYTSESARQPSQVFADVAGIGPRTTGIEPPPVPEENAEQTTEERAQPEANPQVY